MKNGLNCSCDCVWSDCGLIIPRRADPQASSCSPLSLPRPSLLDLPGPALLTIVSLRLLGQLGLVDLVLSVGHLGVVLAVVLTEVSHFTVTMIRLWLALVTTVHWSWLSTVAQLSPLVATGTRWSPALCPAWPGPGCQGRVSEVVSVSVVTGIRAQVNSGHPQSSQPANCHVWCVVSLAEFTHYLGKLSQSWKIVGHIIHP